MLLLGSHVDKDTVAAPTTVSALYVPAEWTHAALNCSSHITDSH